jgi:hypothetical protein
MTPEEWNTLKKALEFVKPCLGKYCRFTPSHSIPTLTLQNRLTGQYAFERIIIIIKDICIALILV